MTTFGGLILLKFEELYAKVEKKSLPKMASKMEPVCNNLTLSGPPAIHVIATLRVP